MDNLLIYLLKVSAGTTMFYLCYLLFFRKETFYLRNRIYLILTLVLPAIVPLISYKIVSQGTGLTSQAVSPENLVIPDYIPDSVIASSVNTVTLDYNKILIMIYLIIAGLLVLRGMISLISTYRIIRQGTPKPGNFPRVIVSDLNLPPFSFFPYAVIPIEEIEKGDYAEILDHEFAHIRQGHTFDMLLSELFIAFQWFNPIVWFIKTSVILNHEYLADQVSLRNNKSVKEYQYRLLHFKAGLKSISLAHNFNSLIKNRIIMINKKPSSVLATFKNIVILPMVAIVAYAFATPEYTYVTPEPEPLTIYEGQQIIQKEVKGIVVDENGKPLVGASITINGPTANTSGTRTETNGRFSILNVRDDATLTIWYSGYKNLTLKPDFQKDMTIKMEKDPEYKAPVPVAASSPPVVQTGPRPQPIVAIDGILSDKNLNDARKDLGYDMGLTKMLMGKEATDKYGEKAVNGVYEITTRKKAIEQGLKPPFPRLSPDDYPTFQNKPMADFSSWVASKVKYPAEARSKNLEGWVSFSFTIQLDGSLTNLVSTIPVDKILSDEVIRVIQSASKWDPPKNKNVDEPLNNSITIKFQLPDKVLDDPIYVVVEKMPQYPGGDEVMMKFINSNLKYPEVAKAAKTEGRVFIKFLIDKEGNSGAVTVLRGVDPLLDAEAVRVIGLLNGWQPATQDGKPVNVWFNIPVPFSLAEAATAK